MTGGPGDLKNGDVTKVKLKILKYFLMHFFGFRLLLFQPENVGKIRKNCRQAIISKILEFLFLNK